MPSTLFLPVPPCQFIATISMAPTMPTAIPTNPFHEHRSPMNSVAQTMVMTGVSVAMSDT